MVSAADIVGTWDVSYVQGGVVRYRYIYTCSAAKTAQWSERGDTGKSGAGTWSLSGSQFIFDWKDAEKEYWTPARGGMSGTYDDYNVVATRGAQTDDKDLIRQWHASIEAGEAFSNPNVCPFAVPYLQHKSPGTKPLDAKNIGPAIQQVRGLAIHTTWGIVDAKVEQTVSICCNTWNSAGVATSAHFAIAADGTLLQFVPTNRKAYAQGGRADDYYISVEIETKNSPANGSQLETARKLFRWVVGKFGVPANLATGYVGPAGNGQFAADAKRMFDPITKKLCADAGVDTTDKEAVAAAASGLSCHYWLHPTKPCPGGPLLKQLLEIAKP